MVDNGIVGIGRAGASLILLVSNVLENIPCFQVHEITEKLGSIV
jgi:hypothetical protein